MTLSSITLSHFRCHDETEFDIAQTVTLVTGDNARGKTSVLEAIYMLSYGRGFREREEVELATFGRDTGMVSGEYRTPAGETSESTILYRRIDDRLYKTYTLNKAKVSLARYRRAQVPVVLFAPHQIDIIVHGPSYRRGYLDLVLSNVYPWYSQALREYEAALRKRNKILEDHTDRATLLRDLDFWDEYMTDRASTITASRQRYIQDVGQASDFAGKRFEIRYVPSRFTREEARSRLDTEASARRTLIGPQKDDFMLSLADGGNQVSVHTLASRSQQRISLLWLKLRELEYVARECETAPILLLDDIYSEFDTANRQIISSLIPRYQTIVTAIDDVSLPDDISRDSQRIVL